MEDMLYVDKFGKAFVFKKIRPGIRSYFMKAGYDDVPYELFGWLFYITLILTYVTYFMFLYPSLQQSAALFVLLMTFVSWFIIQTTYLAIIILYLYFHLNLKIYNRTKQLEKILPDYLQLVSANLKGGMSFDKSLWLAIKPEFGVLAREITIVSKKVMTGNDLTDALNEFSEKYSSPILRRALDLIIGEVESGGKISDVIDRVTENLRKTNALKEEMSAATLTYIIFIGAIVIVVAPALFALSYQLLHIMVGFTSKLTNIETTSLPINFSKVSIDPEDFKLFSVISLIIISTFSAMIISIIEKGDIKGGIKYVPMFVFTSVILYFVFMVILSNIFTGVISFG